MEGWLRPSTVKERRVTRKGKERENKRKGRRDFRLFLKHAKLFCFVP